jgi:translation initiation factor 2B subunit (eIF-2B alpha/beta/delta family)
VALARALLTAGCDVRLCSDAAVGSVLESADAVLVGADAIAPSGFMNKVGTTAIAALARTLGVPVFVLAGREKILPQGVYDTLDVVSGPASEIAPELPESAVENPYFERVPAELVAQVILESGAIDAPAAAAASLWTSQALVKHECIYIK